MVKMRLELINKERSFIFYCGERTWNCCFISLCVYKNISCDSLIGSISGLIICTIPDIITSPPLNNSNNQSFETRILTHTVHGTLIILLSEHFLSYILILRKCHFKTTLFVSISTPEAKCSSSRPVLPKSTTHFIRISYRLSSYTSLLHFSSVCG